MVQSAGYADGLAYFPHCFLPSVGPPILSASAPARQSLPHSGLPNSRLSCSSMPAYNLSNLTPYLAWGIPALAALAWAAVRLSGYGKKDKDKKDEQEDDPQPEQRALRTRPLKPAVDLQAYTYM